MSKARRKRATRWVGQEEMSIRGEAAYIVERAVQGDARIVTLGPLLFFSTETGDAWVLDPGDHLALCLARDRELLAAEIIETADSFTIAWNATYALDGEIFNVVGNSGRALCVRFSGGTLRAPNQWWSEKSGSTRTRI